MLFLDGGLFTIVLVKPQLIRIGYCCCLIASIGYLWDMPSFWAQSICYRFHQLRFLIRLLTCERVAID
jgi:hypothetical protein